MEFLRNVKELFKSLEDREVVSGIQFGDVSKVGDLFDVKQISGDVRYVNQNAWGVLIGWNKKRWGIRGFTVEKSEVLEKLGMVYCINKPLTASDEDVFEIIRALDKKAIAIAEWHVREINSGEF